jgi:UDP-glucose 4-epimerase
VVSASIDLRGCTAVVTGGAGLVGSTICDQLVCAGASRIVALDDLSRGRWDNLDWARAHGPVELVHGDICDRALLASTVVGADVVFHQAAIRITRCAEEPRRALEVLADGTFAVLEAAVQADVRKVIAASSASVLGMADEFPTTERHHPWNNVTLYGACKAFNEGLLRSYHHMYGLDYVALRYFNVYGPRMDATGVYTEVLIRWMERIASGLPPVVLGDGGQSMDFIYVGDVARANLLAAAGDVTDQVCNVGRGVETSLLELASELLAVMDAPPAIEHGPPRTVNDVRRRLASTEAAARLLGFTAEVDLTEGLTRLVDWWQQDRATREGSAA